MYFSSGFLLAAGDVHSAKSEMCKNKIQNIPYWCFLDILSDGYLFGHLLAIWIGQALKFFEANR